MKDPLIPIGRVRAPHGLDGKMWITFFGDTFNPYESLIIGQPNKPLKLLSCDKRRKGYVIRVEGITHISQVEQIKGETIYVHQDWLPAPDEDECYWVDLIGLKVVDVSGRVLGELVNIFRTGANDVYVVDEAKQYLLPAIKDVIKDISIEKGVMTVDIAMLGDLID